MPDSVRSARHGSAVISSDSTGESVAVAGGTVVIVTVAVLGASATDDTGPILAFVGAVLVALIAAFTAGRRQKRALEAEAGRLAQQLDHDRELADLADSRAVMDSAAIALHHASYAAAKVRQDFMTHGAWIAERASETVSAIHERGEALDQLRQRIAVRFGTDHALVQHFDAANGALLEVARQVRWPNDMIDISEAWPVIESKGKDFENARRQFLAAAVSTVGTRIPSDESDIPAP
jgi:hypothetical protein